MSAGRRMAAKILIVEDEAPLAEMLRYNLAAEGFSVAHAETGEEAELMLAEEQPDLIVLDWMLPAVSGIELCRRLRARPETRALPILMLTARGEEADRIRGLATGADDYVVQPFSLAELVTRGPRHVHLGPTEFRLLEFLMESRGRVLSRAQLLDAVWGRDAEVDERTVDVHIGRLRKALIRGKERDPIRTVRGSGYALDLVVPRVINGGRRAD